MANCVHLLEGIINKKLDAIPKSFKLSPYLAEKYIGLLLEESTGDWFKSLVTEFATQAGTLLGIYLLTEWYLCIIEQSA